MKLIALAVPSVVLSIYTVTAEPPAALVVQAATPIAQATPMHSSPPPISRPPAEIIVQAAGSTLSQPDTTASLAPTGSKQSTSEPAIRPTDHPANTNQSVDPELFVPKEKVIALVKRIQEQQRQIENNQAEIDQQVYDITNVVDQAFFFSRRASK
jgi:hypothetical protein